MKAELVVNAKATLGEGPVWDKKNKLLYWVDTVEKKIHKYHPSSNTNDYIEIEDPVGAIALRESVGLLLATQGGFYQLDEGGKELTFIDDPEHDLPNNRFNDGKCDSAGRFWAGTMDLDEKDPVGSLYVLSTDMRIRKVLSGITISNGLAWSSDDKRMYYIDSPTKQVVVFDYDVNSGEISNKRTVIEIPDDEGVPDGMTIDKENHLWIAHWGAYKVSRWNPETGEQIGEIYVPAKQVTSCVFGGEELDELYITTARRGLENEELKQYPESGGLFRVKTNVIGSPSYYFKG